VQHLADEVRRHISLRHAKALRPMAGWHVECTEDQVEHREIGSEVFIAALVGARVVPAVEHRAGQHIPEWPKRPIQVCMHQRRHADRERRGPK
jgi:hypothetical protein